VVFGVSVWCSVCRDFGDGGAGGGFINDCLVGCERGDEGLQREVVDRARITPAGLMNERDRVVGEQRVVAPGQRQVVTQVATGLLVGHRLHRVAQPDALVERGEHAEFHPPPQGGLADEQARERARRVEVMICQEPQRFQLVIAEQVRLLDDHDGGASPFSVFGGERVGGLWSQRGVMGQGLPTQRGDDAVVDAPDADGGVGQVDHGVAAAVQGGQRGAHGDGLAGADSAGDRLQQLRAVLPCEITVIDEAHPLRGERLRALSFRRRQGVLRLVVVLPDGTPGMVAADATDVFGDAGTVVAGVATTLSVDGVRRLRSLLARDAEAASPSRVSQ
jgi:hypothetical protein